MIKAVLFDFDCTLYSRDLAYVGLLPAFKKHFEGRLTPGMSDEALLQALWRCDRVGSYTNGGGWPRILDRQIEAGLWAAPPTAEEMLDFIHGHFADALTPYPDAAPLFCELKDRGYKLGLITNGPVDFQTKKIKKTGLYDFFAAVLISEAEKCSKPNPFIFAHALERLGCAAEEAVFVGDSPTADVCGARGAGLHAVWMRYYDLWPAPYARPLYSIEKLCELPAVLQEIERNCR